MERHFFNVCDKHAPRRKKLVRGMRCPWLTREIKDLMNKRDFHLRRARKTNAEVDWSAYRQARNYVSNKIKSQKWYFHRKEFDNNLGNPTAFWKTMKRVFPNKKGNSTVPDCMKMSEGLVTDKRTIGENFNRFFTTAASRLMENVQSMDNILGSDDDFTDGRFVFHPVTYSFIYRQLTKLKVNKAMRLDQIPSCMLKDGASIITNSVTYLVNLSLSVGSMPNEWKQAKVIPLHKSGCREDMDNYRLISILPVISKIAESAVNVQLQQYLMQHNLLSSVQSGFRKYHSTQTAVPFFSDSIRRNTELGQMTGALFIDLRKAFDTVPHNALILKLSRFGIKEKSLEWFKSYLSSRTQAVCIGNQLSSHKNVLSGVPQGSVVGLVLFILYINDLVSSVQFSQVMMYADDTVIYYSTPQLSEIELKLNLDLLMLNQWLLNNKLILNEKKTEVMIFGTRQRLMRQNIDEFSLEIDGNSIKRTETFKYLSVVFDGILSFNEHIQCMKKKVSKMLGLFSRIRPLLTVDSANRIYKVMVLPVLDYCDIVFHECGQGNQDELEFLQRRASRIVYRNSGLLSTDDTLISLDGKLYIREEKIKS